MGRSRADKAEIIGSSPLRSTHYFLVNLERQWLSLGALSGPRLTVGEARLPMWCTWRMLSMAFAPLLVLGTTGAAAHVLIGDAAVADSSWPIGVTDLRVRLAMSRRRAGSCGGGRAVAHTTDDSSRDIPKGRPRAVSFPSHRNGFGPRQCDSGEHSRVRRQRCKSDGAVPGWVVSLADPDERLALPASLTPTEGDGYGCR
jgi:hypothetical protein